MSKRNGQNIQDKLDSQLTEAFCIALVYASKLPGQDLPRNKDAQNDLNSLFVNSENKPHSPQKTIALLKIFRERILAKIPQIEFALPTLQKSSQEQISKINPVRVGDIDRAKSGFISEEQFQKETRNFAKLIQEVLTSHGEKIPGIQNHQITNIVIDPSQITDTLLHNLGLEKYIPPKKTNKVLKTQIRSKAIPEIKEMLGHLIPIRFSSEKLSREYFRLYLISKGKHQGKIIGTQIIGDRKILFLTTIDDALRRLNKIQKSFQTEYALINEANSAISQYERHLRTHQKDFSQKYHNLKNEELSQLIQEDQTLKDLQSLLQSTIEKLSKASNPHKKNALKKLRAALTPFKKNKNGTLSFNPGATQTQIVSVKTDLEKRASELRYQAKYFADDRQIIVREIDAVKSPFRSFYNTVTRMHPRLHIYHNKSLNREYLNNFIRNLQLQLVYPHRAVMDQKNQYQPYSSFSEQIHSQTNVTIEKALQISKLMDRNNLTEIKDNSVHFKTLQHEFTKIFLLAKIAELYFELQKIRENHLNDYQDFSIEDFQKEIKRIKTWFSARQVADKIRVSEYDEIYDKCYHLLNSLNKRAIEMAETGGDLESMKKIWLKTKVRYKEFDFSKLF